MLGITPFGWVHTIISLIAVACGIISFIRYGAILWATKIGRTYVLSTALAASYPRRYRIHDQASCWRTAGVRS